MMIENILKAMEKGSVRLKYTSLRSGREKEVVGTLQGETYIRQNPTSDKILFWDVENNKWEDIECSTIISWINLGTIH
jgi:hypothetical protein